MNDRTRAVLYGVAAFIATFVVAYAVGEVIVDLVVVLVSLALAAIAASAVYNVALGRPWKDLPWRDR